MIITTAIFLVAALLLFTCRDNKTGNVNFALLGTGIVMVCVGSCLGLNSAAGLEIDVKNTLLAGLGIIAGGLLIWAMMAAFAGSTSPMSETAGEYMMFGWFKWDDYAELLALGAVVVLFCAGYLYHHGQHSLYEIDKKNRYRAAYEELRAQDRAILVAKSKTASVKHKQHAKQTHRR